MKYLVFNSKKEASKEAYKILRSLIDENSTLGLATGSTPTDLYAEMIADYKAGNFSYKNIKSYNLDEYVGISYDHPESYHKFMDTNLFDHVDINKANTHVPDASASDLELAVKSYQEELNKAQIDVQILGIGGNGHIGFNEPSDSFPRETHCVQLAEETIEANQRFFSSKEEVPKEAYTMGIGTIMHAEKILLLVSGKDKASILQKVLEGPVTPDIPASILQFHPNVILIADEEALSLCKTV